jgi:hypothetical protein
MILQDITVTDMKKKEKIVVHNDWEKNCAVDYIIGNHVEDFVEIIDKTDGKHEPICNDIDIKKLPVITEKDLPF